MPEEKKKEKKKREFSKGHVIFADFLVLFVYCVNAILTYMDKMPVSDVAIAIITCYGAFATGGYFTINAIRDTSLNKYNLRISEDENGHTFKEEIPMSYEIIEEEGEMKDGSI